MTQEDEPTVRPLYRVVNGRKVYGHYKPEVPPETKADKDTDIELLTERFDRFEELLKSLFKMWQKREREEILQHELASYLDYLYS
jgi:hypothetical protein